jgi:hypothetical protein
LQKTNKIPIRLEKANLPLKFHKSISQLPDRTVVRSHLSKGVGELLFGLVTLFGLIFLTEIKTNMGAAITLGIFFCVFLYIGVSKMRKRQVLELTFEGLQLGQNKVNWQDVEEVYVLQEIKISGTYRTLMFETKKAEKIAMGLGEIRMIPGNFSTGVTKKCRLLP